ncbi:MAG: glycosyltransferase [Planctomycetota bacterium]
MNERAVDRSGAGTIALVIPGRNCAATLDKCLESVERCRERLMPRELRIVYVDDSSTDSSRNIAGRFSSVMVLESDARGPGAARNVGWRASEADWVWFVDSDCIVEPDALEYLLAHESDGRTGGVSGAYGIANPHSMVARLIHEEIAARHRRMALAPGGEVDFLASFSVLYRREALERTGGFDVRYLKGQDAELAFRVQDAGYVLRFEPRSIAHHHHEERLLGYLRTQRRHGYWRVLLHGEHKGRAVRNSYSDWTDHLQPPVALAAVGVLVLSLAWWPVALLGASAVFALALLQLPMSAAIASHARVTEAVLFVPFGMVRALWRGVGLAHGFLRPAKLPPPVGDGAPTSRG